MLSARVPEYSPPTVNASLSQAQHDMELLVPGALWDPSSNRTLAGIAQLLTATEYFAAEDGASFPVTYRTISEHEFLRKVAKHSFIEGALEVGRCDAVAFNFVFADSTEKEAVWAARLEPSKVRQARIVVSMNEKLRSRSFRRQCETGKVVLNADTNKYIEGLAEAERAAATGGPCSMCAVHVARCELLQKIVDGVALHDPEPNTK